MTENKGDLISREALKEHKFLTPQVKVIGGRHSGKLKEQIILAYQKGWNDCIDAIIDNAPTVEPEITDDDLRACMAESHHLGYELAEIKYKRSQGEWIRTALYGETCYECNKCNRHQTHITKFCPNCGADMRPKPNHLRDCENCVHHSDNGCEVWECEFEKRSDV